MLDVCLLGTGGTMPMPSRALTALHVRYNGKALLIDCGEGTQVQMRRAKQSVKSLDALLFTHYHADHISGLPGMLLSIGQDGRIEPLRLIGPRGLESVVNALRVIAPELPFALEFEELTESAQELCVGDMRITAFALEHGMPCYGYAIRLDRAPRFDLERASALGLPKCYWSALQSGETVTYEGRVYLPSEVLGVARRGLSILYATDTRPTEQIVRYGRDADLMILEGMYADAQKIENALKNRHMLFHEAAMLAKNANAQALWLTHFSPSLDKPQDYLEVASAIFTHTVIAEDLQSIDLRFKE